ncbi:MAG: transposase [Bryobacteraceae bacterium]|nr:transposase [Bryobacteraceae bacterium]
MPNHVHWIVTPVVPVSRMMNLLKGRTARTANQILGRVGRPFWQREYDDHCPRNEESLAALKLYVERNPVEAKLALQPEEFAWSSANPKW